MTAADVLLFLGAWFLFACIAAPVVGGWLRRRARIEQDRRNYESLLEKAHRDLRRRT